MPLPTDAQQFEQSIDPSDLESFQWDGFDPDTGEAGLLDVGETVNTFTITLDSAAVALGVTIRSDGAYAPVKVELNTSIKFWLEIPLEADRSNVAFAAGVLVGIELTIVTGSVPFRRKQRTLVVEIKQR